MITEAALTQTETVYRAMRGDLLTCRLPSGCKFKIADLCTRHEPSLGAVREALSRLTAEGLVVCWPQRGFEAAAISPEELKDLTLAHVEIEALCLGMAVKQGTLAWKERLLRISHLLARTEKRAPDDADRLSEAGRSRMVNSTRHWLQPAAVLHCCRCAACSTRSRNATGAFPSRWQKPSATWIGNILS